MDERSESSSELERQTRPRTSALPIPEHMRIFDWEIPDEAVLAGIGAAGVVMGRFMDWMSKRVQVRGDEESMLRTEYRAEIALLRAEIVTMKVEIQEWRDKSYAGIQENLRLSSEFEMQRVRMASLEADCTDIRTKSEERAKKVTAMETELIELRIRAERRLNPARRASDRNAMVDAAIAAHDLGIATGVIAERTAEDHGAQDSLGDQD